nr:hypothetical protein BaRGS_023060 [Batillaria attramentaria]
MENDVENPQDAVKVKFLQQQSMDKGKGWMARLTNREKYLAGFCVLLFLACVVFIFVAYARDSQSTRGE